MYTVILTARAEKELDKLDASTAVRIVKALDQLAPDPYAAANVKALNGGGFRLRVGDWRVLYDIDDGAVIVLVVKIAHRGTAYRK